MITLSLIAALNFGDFKIDWSNGFYNGPVILYTFARF